MWWHMEKRRYFLKNLNETVNLATASLLKTRKKSYTSFNIVRKKIQKADRKRRKFIARSKVIQYRNKLILQMIVQAPLFLH